MTDPTDPTELWHTAARTRSTAAARELLDGAIASVDAALNCESAADAADGCLTRTPDVVIAILDVATRIYLAEFQAAVAESADGGCVDPAAPPTWREVRDGGHVGTGGQA